MAALALAAQPGAAPEWDEPPPRCDNAAWLPRGAVAPRLDGDRGADAAADGCAPTAAAAPAAAPPAAQAAPAPARGLALLVSRALAFRVPLTVPLAVAACAIAAASFSSLKRCPAPAPPVVIIVEELEPFWPPQPPEEGAAAWGYDLRGADWASLRLAGGGAAYPACGAGRAQSPVDLPPFPAAPGGGAAAPLTFAYARGAPWAITERPRGHPGFQLAPEAGGPAGVPQRALNFSLGRGFPAAFFSQFHFHAPSEHTLGGAALPMELHLVHVTAANATVVVALLFDEADVHNAAFDAFFWEAHAETHNIAGVDVGALLGEALFAGGAGADDAADYFSYAGSLTTPPCTEGVTWVVLHSRVGVSPLQVVAYQYALSGVKNARAAQPLNARKIGLYSTPLT